MHDADAPASICATRYVLAYVLPATVTPASADATLEGLHLGHEHQPQWQREVLHVELARTAQ